MEDRFQVGIITSTHGLGGELKVYPTTDDPKRFSRLKTVILEDGKDGLLMEVEGVKYFKQFVILKFKGVDDVEAAQKYRQKSLYVPRKDAVRLRRDEYFIADLIGLRVLDEEESPIGVLRDVLSTGANDVYVIDLDDGRELLLPAIRQCILRVAVEEGYLKVHILDGLLEER